ncbi:MAG: hypothetical protein V1859_00430 [archaeon]
MDINKVQKLNKLALDLKKYNLENGESFNSVSAAEKIYGEDNNFMTKHSLEKKDDNMENYERDIRNLTIALKNSEERTNQVILKMNEMIKEFNELKDSVKSLRNNIDSLSRQSAASLQTLANHGNQNKEQTNREEPVQEKKAVQKPIDRNGVSPADISIDKYFYCGKK